MRRLFTFVLVAATTAALATTWLRDDAPAGRDPTASGAVRTVEWDADQLAAQQGLVPVPASVLPTPAPSGP